MKILSNVLEEHTIKSLLDVAGNVIDGNSGNHRVWTNLAWDSRLVLGSGTVLCVAVPDNLILEIEKSFVDSDLLDLNLYRPISETKTVVLHIWPKGSYIAPHNDSAHGQAATVYLNKDWLLSDGGLFCYVTDEGIRCVVPEYNTGVQNSKAEKHFTTPVTADKIRISLQVFISNK